MGNVLHEWLHKNRMTRKELAEKSGMSRATVSMMASGRYAPGARAATKIEKATNGEVKVADLIAIGRDVQPAKPKEPEQTVQASVEHKPEQRQIVVTISLV